MAEPPSPAPTEPGAYPEATQLPSSSRLVLKACIFATGLAGVVAEYVMSTLASYLLGNTVLQWTLTISLMLFAMGIGSRLSRFIRGPVLDAFVAVELTLSVVCATSGVATYFLSAWITPLAPVIYATCLVIGLLIGVEIPLATRLNQVFDELRVNISSVLEKDYYGALVGGLLFAFVALPHLGLTYTPITLGAINLLAAALLFLRHRRTFRWRRALGVAFVVVPLGLGLLAWTAEPIVLYGEQQKYRDRVVYQEQTPYQRIVMTRFKSHHWLYLNGNEQFSSYDEERYHEPLVHPAMTVAAAHRRILILGGGDGLALREVLKHPQVETVTLVDIDPAMTRLGQTHPVLVGLNGGAFDDSRVRSLNQDAYLYLETVEGWWDVILIDLPDPKTIDLARLYSVEFYRLARRHLSPGGVLVTQATSPFFTRRAFLSIARTLTAADLVAVPYHNHVPTLGEWGWVLAMRGRDPTTPTPASLKERLSRTSFQGIPTRFLNRDAMIGMLHFGKGFDHEVEVTDQRNLAIYYYYRDGDWDL